MNIRLLSYPKSTHMLGAFIALVLSSAASADTTSGQFTLDGVALKPSHVAAFRVRDQLSARKFETYVMLTTQPVDSEKISASRDPYSTAINDDAVRDADYLAISVAADGTADMNAHVGGTQYIDSSGIMFGERGSLLADCSINTLTHVACTIKVAKPVKTQAGPAWSVDVQFDVAVRARAAGIPMAKDGGDAGKALLALVAAAKGDDLNKMIALLAPIHAEDALPDYNTPAENLVRMQDLMKLHLPKQPKITGGELINVDRAVLEVESGEAKEVKFLYLVEMLRSNGRWQYSSRNIAGMLR